MNRVLGFNVLILCVVAGYGLLLLVTEGAEAAVRTVGGHWVTFATSAVGATLLVSLGRPRPTENRSAALAAAALTFVNAMSLTYAPMVIDGFPQWSVLNWWGKILSLVYCVVIFCLLPEPLRRETGILRPLRSGSLRATSIALGVFAALGLALAFSGGTDSGGVVEAAVFQLTMPSLSEEFLFRGILLSLFARAAPGRRPVLGAGLGWGVVASSVLFGLVHGFVYAPSAGFMFSWIPVLATGVLGAAFAWLTVRSGSIWPAVIAHSLLNATGPVLRLAGLI